MRSDLLVLVAALPPEQRPNLRGAIRGVDHNGEVQRRLWDALLVGPALIECTAGRGATPPWIGQHARDGQGGKDCGNCGLVGCRRCDPRETLGGA